MGRVSTYPKEVQGFIKEHPGEYSSKELSRELEARYGFKKSPDALRSWCKAHGVRFKSRKGQQRPEASKFPAQMHAYVREIAYGRGYREITGMVNGKFGEGTITAEQMRRYLKNHKIKTGRDGQFKKGHVPWTKGKKREEFIKDPDKMRRVQDAQFKKGHVPVNTLPLGTIIKNTEGYLVRKKQTEGTQNERWEFLHRAVWEENHGPIPEGMVVAFKDSNPEHCEIENLMLITKAENSAMNANGYRSEDPDLTLAGLMVVRIEKRRGELKRARKKDGARSQTKKV